MLNTVTVCWSKTSWCLPRPFFHNLFLSSSLSFPKFSSLRPFSLLVIYSLFMPCQLMIWKPADRNIWFPWLLDSQPKQLTVSLIRPTLSQRCWLFSLFSLLSIWPPACLAAFSLVLTFSRHCFPAVDNAILDVKREKYLYYCDSLNEPILSLALNPFVCVVVGSGTFCSFLVYFDTRIWCCTSCGISTLFFLFLLLLVFSGFY